MLCVWVALVWGNGQLRVCSVSPLSCYPPAPSGQLTPALYRVRMYTCTYCLLPNEYTKLNLSSVCLFQPCKSRQHPEPQQVAMSVAYFLMKASYGNVILRRS